MALAYHLLDFVCIICLFTIFFCHLHFGQEIIKKLFHRMTLFMMQVRLPLVQKEREIDILECQSTEWSRNDNFFSSSIHKLNEPSTKMAYK